MTEVFNFGTPAAPDNVDGSTIYTFGCEWFAAQAGTVIGGRWRRSTNAPAITCSMVLYSVTGQTLLARKDFTAAPGDNDILFTTPVAVGANSHYVSGVLSDRYPVTLGGWPFTTLNLTAPAGVNGRLLATTAGNPVYPSTIHASAANFFVGPLWNPQLQKVTYRAAGLERKWRFAVITERISVLSLERVRVNVQADSNGLPYNPTTATVDFAFLTSALTNPISTDWKTGNWDVTRIGSYVAQCNVGPAGAAVLAVGEYYVWVRITDAAAGETPIGPLAKLIVS